MLEALNQSVTKPDPKFLPLNFPEKELFLPYFDCGYFYFWKLFSCHEKFKMRKRGKKKKSKKLLDGYNYDALLERDASKQLADNKKEHTSIAKHVIREIIAKKTLDMTKIPLPAYIMGRLSPTLTIFPFSPLTYVASKV